MLFFPMFLGIAVYSYNELMKATELSDAVGLWWVWGNVSGKVTPHHDGFFL